MNRYWTERYLSLLQAFLAFNRAFEVLVVGSCLHANHPRLVGIRISDVQELPLAIQLTGANRNDSQQALALVGAIPPLQGKRAVHVIDLIAFLVTAVMTLRQSGKVYVAAALSHCSRCGIPSTAVDLADGDGW